jgi:hypothetical protein
MYYDSIFTGLSLAVLDSLQGGGPLFHVVWATYFQLYNYVIREPEYRSQHNE